MAAGMGRRSDRQTSTRKWMGRAAILALAGGTVMLATGCDDKFDEFRAAAAPQLEAGVNALLDGFVEGVFAVVEPNEPADGAG